MRILPQPALGIGDADQAEQFDRAPVRRGGVHAAVLLQRFGDLPADGEHRIQRGHRLLEHHADLAAAYFAHLCIRELQDIAAGKANLTACDASGRIGDQAQHRQRTDRLAGAALADDRHGLAWFDGVGNAVDRAHESGTGAELGVQILHFQKWWQYLSPTQPL